MKFTPATAAALAALAAPAAADSALLAEILGMPIVGGLRLRLEGLAVQPPDGAGVIRWKAGDLHRAESSDGRLALLAATEGLHGHAGDAGTGVSAERIEIWPPDGPPILSVFDFEIEVSLPSSASPSFRVSFGDLRYGRTSSLPDGSQMDEALRVGRFSATASGLWDDDSRSSEARIDLSVADAAAVFAAAGAAGIGESGRHGVQY